VDLMRVDPLHLLVGMGLGSFPRMFYLAQIGTQELPGYRLGRDAVTGKRYLVLTGGRGMYLDQRIAARPGSELRLKGEVRSPSAGATLSISLCEKSLLNSLACEEATVAAGPTWQSFEVLLRLPPGIGSRSAKAPRSLSLHNGLFGSRVEVTQLSLVEGQDELLANGSFEYGLDRWFMTSDLHLAWRALSTPLQIAFEQGALGVLAWLALGVAAVAIIRKPLAAPGVPAAFAGALVGFVAVGLFDTLLDSPRLILLVALIGAAGLCSQGTPAPKAQSGPRGLMPDRARSHPG